MKHVKYIILSILILFCLTTVNTQVLRIYKNNNSVKTIRTFRVDSIVAIGYDELNPKDCIEFVDLGLSVKWATCNVGATTISEYGNYYAWGETYCDKISYDYDHYIHTCINEYGIHDYVNLGNISGNPEYDVARANWGGKARIPTRDEAQELIEKCSWKDTTILNTGGVFITGPNGSSIFLPDAGLKVNTFDFSGENGRYWTSISLGDVSASAIFTDFRKIEDNSGTRTLGLTIRPVSDY